MIQNNWYVLTGGPSSGKTTLLNELENRGKNIVVESARFYIEKQLKNGFSLEQIRQDEKMFQTEVFKHKLLLHEELLAHVPVFLDRGYHDTLAYLTYYGLEVERFIVETCENTTYKKVFVLDMLPYEKDNIRTEGPSTAKKLHQILIDVYKKSGHDVQVIPVMPVNERADWIEAHT